MPDQESSPSDVPFEQALFELQRIAAELESGALGLEQSLARFEEGIAHLRKCHAILEQAEQRIEILTGSDTQGNPTFAPFDARSTAEQAGSSAGRRPRKRAVRTNPAASSPLNESPVERSDTRPAFVEATESPDPVDVAAKPETDHNTSRLF